MLLARLCVLTLEQGHGHMSNVKIAGRNRNFFSIGYKMIIKRHLRLTRGTQIVYVPVMGSDLVKKLKILI